MATVDSALFTNPLYPRRASSGITCVYHSETIATTSLNESTQADRVRLIPLPDKVKLIGFFITNGDLDTGGTSGDADIVLNDDDADVILYNAGTAFTAAVTTPLWVDCQEIQVNAQGDTKASLDFLVNTAMTTPQQGAVTITLFYHSVP